jgi:hypothetical protein
MDLGYGSWVWILGMDLGYGLGYGVGIPYNRWFRGATLWVERLRELRFVLVK